MILTQIEEVIREKIRKKEKCSKKQVDRNLQAAIAAVVVIEAQTQMMSSVCIVKTNRITTIIILEAKKTSFNSPQTPTKVTSQAIKKK